MEKITPCPCCNTFDCLNIDHNPYETREWNELSIKINDEGRWEEFHQKRGNGHMYGFHKARRLEMLRQLKAIAIT